MPFGCLINLLKEDARVLPPEVAHIGPVPHSLIPVVDANAHRAPSILRRIGSRVYLVLVPASVGSHLQRVDIVDNDVCFADLRLCEGQRLREIATLKVDDLFDALVFWPERLELVSPVLLLANLDTVGLIGRSLRTLQLLASSRKGLHCISPQTRQFYKI
jgi:hypothetical protein